MSTMSDVLPQSNQEPLPAGPAAPRKDQAAIERLQTLSPGEIESVVSPQLSIVKVRAPLTTTSLGALFK